jgi:hypothetical protein
MQVGVQWADTMAPHAEIDYYTWGWEPSLDVVWMIVPTTPTLGGPQVEWDVEVERSSPIAVTYHITVKNLTESPAGIEGRFGILNA